eukprot:6466227-Pyramimonas_sp.AAC.1
MERRSNPHLHPHPPPALLPIRPPRPSSAASSCYLDVSSVEGGPRLLVAEVVGQFAVARAPASPASGIATAATSADVQCHPAPNTRYVFRRVGQPFGMRSLDSQCRIASGSPARSPQHRRGA